MPAEPADQEALPQAGNALRSLATLLLLIHLFFVVVATLAHFARSPLQTRLLNRFAFYTRTLYLDADFTASRLRGSGYRFSAEPLYLTHAGEDDVDHRIELLPENAAAEDDTAWNILGHAGWRGGENYRRHQRLARLLSALASEEADAARIAQSIGRHAQQQRGQAPQQIRCRRHMLQSMAAISGGTPEQQDAYAGVYFRTDYAANLLLSDAGVQVVKIDAASQVAEPGSGSAAQAPQNNVPSRPADESPRGNPE